jgi:hypothetical protein
MPGGYARRRATSGRRRIFADVICCRASGERVQQPAPARRSPVTFEIHRRNLWVPRAAATLEEVAGGVGIADRPEVQCRPAQPPSGGVAEFAPTARPPARGRHSYPATTATEHRPSALSATIRCTERRLIFPPSIRSGLFGSMSTRASAIRGNSPGPILGRQQHRQNRGVGVADRVDADTAHHRRDGAVGLRFHPRRPVLQSQVGQPRQQYTSRCSARAFR